MSVRTITLFNYTICLAVIAILSCATTVVLAEESAEITDSVEVTSSTTASSSAESAVSEELVVEPKPVPVQRKAALQIQGQKRITNLAANMSNRMEAAVSRMQNVVTRLKSRLAILESENVDTAAARAELTATETKITLASNILKTIDAAVAAFVASENPKEAWLPVRNTFGTTRDAILAAHTGLQTTLDLIKASTTVPLVVPDADTTSSTSGEVIE